MDVKKEWLHSEAMPRVPKKPPSQIAPFGLRLQPELKARIESAAADNGRSMNAEIIARLEASFGGMSYADPFLPSPPIASGEFLDTMKEFILAVQSLKNPKSE